MNFTIVHCIHMHFDERHYRAVYQNSFDELMIVYCINVLSFDELMSVYSF